MIVREEAPERVVIGFLDSRIMVNLVGKLEVKTVADAAEERMRRACESLGGSTTQSTRHAMCELLALSSSQPARLTFSLHTLAARGGLLGRSQMVEAWPSSVVDSCVPNP